MNRDSRGTQRERILALFESRSGHWIGLPEILSLGFAQFGARILELRRAGYRIENRTEHRDGKVLSWYRLMPSAPLEHNPVPVSSQCVCSLFGDLTPDRSYAE